ncbi:MAG: beta-propeller domain-containing protein, methanol dehydrogenase [Leptolyngbya foveolarum]|uniref:Beta-propeller domain-containing protein, methanol dehydrogenase n=1 Tax=Leptolyngbya foveolarum TaxID=47253 RepID=A0A2W4WH53_9CYAN|nr:MAG: beta-propeller domain-containing protein, methanol dehydrogenase [Leptolyngbya foveolarum]
MSQKFRSVSLGWLRQLLCLIAIAIFSTHLVAAPVLATSMYTMPTSVDSSTWVLDEASQISRINEGQIASELKVLAQDTGNEIRFVTVHRLDYEVTAQSFADELLARWFPTPEARANETVIVLDDVTNTIGISVGDETANVLTDDIAESVVGETMKVPLLQSNQYNQSFVDASDRLVAVLSGAPDPGPPVYDNSVETERTYATAEETAASRGSSTTWVIVLLVAATVIPMATYYWYLSIGG